MVAAPRAEGREAKRIQCMSQGSGPRALPGRPQFVPNSALLALVNSNQQSRRRPLEIQTRCQDIETEVTI
jgi:hypothetical protein